MFFVLEGHGEPLEDPWGSMGPHGAPMGCPWAPMGRPWGAHGAPWGTHGFGKTPGAPYPGPGAPSALRASSVIHCLREFLWELTLS